MSQEKSNRWRQVQEPTITIKDGPTGGRVFNHPAYATISANRVSGTANLFGSHVGHDGFVSIKVQPAEMTRTGYSESIYSNLQSYIEVRMSEAQWVAMVSRMNHGFGVPCTLVALGDGKTMASIPQIPDVEKASERMQTQIDDLLATKIREIEKQQDIIEKLCEKLPAKTRSAILRELGLLTQHLEVNHQFAHTVLAEHKEKLVAESKVEINAMINSAVHGIGLESVQQLGAIFSANPVSLMKLLSSDMPDDPDKVE